MLDNYNKDNDRWLGQRPTSPRMCIMNSTHHVEDKSCCVDPSARWSYLMHRARSVNVVALRAHRSISIPRVISISNCFDR